jgi:hypothetical protein
MTSPQTTLNGGGRFTAEACRTRRAYSTQPFGSMCPSAGCQQHRGRRETSSAQVDDKCGAGFNLHPEPSQAVHRDAILSLLFTQNEKNNLFNVTCWTEMRVQ